MGLLWLMIVEKLWQRVQICSNLLGHVFHGEFLRRPWHICWLVSWGCRHSCTKGGFLIAILAGTCTQWALPPRGRMKTVFQFYPFLSSEGYRNLGCWLTGGHGRWLHCKFCWREVRGLQPSNSFRKDRLISPHYQACFSTKTYCISSASLGQHMLTLRNGKLWVQIVTSNHTELSK